MKGEVGVVPRFRGKAEAVILSVNFYMPHIRAALPAGLRARTKESHVC